MKLCAQTSVYWLGINKEIDNHIMHCEQCQVLGRSQQKEPAMPMEIPSRPWQMLGVDLFLQGKHMVCHCFRLFFKVTMDMSVTSHNI